MRYSKKHTHFIGTEKLIDTARTIYNVHSENYAYPEYYFGHPTLKYYCELWSDGMDYNLMYWLIEYDKLSDYLSDELNIIPFIYFDNQYERIKFNETYFVLLIENLINNKYNELIQSNLITKNELVCPYLEFDKENYKMKGKEKLIKCSVKDNFQEEIEFYINSKFLDD